MKEFTDILIVGYGNIGKHMENELRNAGTIHIFDPIKGYELDNCLYDIAFICVPTEMLSDGSCDTHIVDEVVDKVNATVIVIKSTIPVGHTDYLRGKTGKNIIHSPEYYGTTQHADPSPNFLVLGGDRDSCDKVAQLYYKIKNGSFRIYFTDSKTAELAKYMENCFLALKVTFCAEFATVAKEFGISYPQLREIFIADPRMGDSHTFIDPKQPFYSSHCLNKDIHGFIAQSDKAHLMRAVLDINEAKKRDKDY